MIYSHFIKNYHRIDKDLFASGVLYDVTSIMCFFSLFSGEPRMRVDSLAFFLSCLSECFGGGHEESKREPNRTNH